MLNYLRQGADQLRVGLESLAAESVLESNFSTQLNPCERFQLSPKTRDILEKGDLPKTVWQNPKIQSRLVEFAINNLDRLDLEKDLQGLGGTSFEAIRQDFRLIQSNCPNFSQIVLPRCVPRVREEFDRIVFWRQFSFAKNEDGEVKIWGIAQEQILSYIDKVLSLFFENWPNDKALQMLILDFYGKVCVGEYRSMTRPNPEVLEQLQGLQNIRQLFKLMPDYLQFLKSEDQFLELRDTLAAEFVSRFPRYYNPNRGLEYALRFLKTIQLAKLDHHLIVSIEEPIDDDISAEWDKLKLEFDKQGKIPTLKSVHPLSVFDRLR